MKKLLSVVMLALALVASPAMASDWSFVEVGYSAQDLNNRSSDVANLLASVEVGEHVFFQGGYTKGLDTDLDLGVVTGAVGLHNGLFYGKVIGSVVVANRADFDKYAFSAEAGLRGQLTDKVELRGGVIADGLRQQKFDDVSWLATVGAEYAFSDAFRVGVDVRGKDSFAEGKLSARLYW